MSYLASEWQAEELSVLLNHVRFRYPLPLDNAGDESRIGISLSAFYQYPVHSCLVSLRKRIKVAYSGETAERRRGDFIQIANELSR